MLVRKDGEWSLYTTKVTYTEKGEGKTTWALPDKNWWEDTIAKHDHLELVSFDEVTLTEEQLTRFEEIKEMPDDFPNQYTEYIETGAISEELPRNHPMKTMLLEKENEKLKQDNLNTMMALTELFESMGGAL